MYFIPRNNRVYSFLVSIPQVSWYAITLVSCLVVCVLWTIFIDWPVRSRITTAQQEQQEMLQKNTVSERLIGEVRQLEVEVQRLAHAVQQVAPIKTGLHQLLATSLESGLSLASCTPRGVLHDSWCTQHPATISYAGSFKQAQQYLKQLSLLAVPLTISRVAFERQGNGKLGITLDCSVMEVHAQQA